jgi:ornithine carbamoyltransferase
MRSFLRITDYTKKDIFEIFDIANAVQAGKYKDFLKGKTTVMFFPEASIRTRVTFEKGIFLLGGQTILFPPQTLDKKEEIKDIIGYLNNWCDVIVVRHKDISLMEKMQTFSGVPVINAMTDQNHPCEIISDLYTLSKLRKDFLNDSYLFCGGSGNIGLAWKEAAEVMGFRFAQCCPKGYEMDDTDVFGELRDAVEGRDIICTDSIQEGALADFKGYRITKEMMDRANPGAILNPCPPFYRGEEVSGDVIESEYFPGYEFKKSLLVVQQAIIIYCLSH